MWRLLTWFSAAFLVLWTGSDCSSAIVFAVAYEIEERSLFTCRCTSLMMCVRYWSKLKCGSDKGIRISDSHSVVSKWRTVYGQEWFT